MSVVCSLVTCIMYVCMYAHTEDSPGTEVWPQVSPHTHPKGRVCGDLHCYGRFSGVQAASPAVVQTRHKCSASRIYSTTRAQGVSKVTVYTCIVYSMLVHYNSLHIVTPLIAPSDEEWKHIQNSLSRAIRKAAKVALGKDSNKVQKYIMSGRYTTLHCKNL